MSKYHIEFREHSAEYDAGWYVMEETYSDIYYLGGPFDSYRNAKKWLDMARVPA